MEVKISNVENVPFATFSDFVFCDGKKNDVIFHSVGILHHTQQMVYRAAFRKKKKKKKQILLAKPQLS